MHRLTAPALEAAKFQAWAAPDDGSCPRSEPERRAAVVSAAAAQASKFPASKSFHAFCFFSARKRRKKNQEHAHAASTIPPPFPKIFQTPLHPKQENIIFKY
jgi:hypothetical protein